MPPRAELPFVILDTNVLVSAFINSSPASPALRIVNAVSDGWLQLLLSDELTDEFDEVLRRPHLILRHRLFGSQIDDVLFAIRRSGLFPKPRVPRIPPPDPKDMHVWSLLEAVPDAVLVTGSGRCSWPRLRTGR